MEWEETNTRTWIARTEEGCKMAFHFTWSDNPQRLTIRIAQYTFGPYSLEEALSINERLKDILGDDGAAMESYADYNDGSTEIHRTYNDGKEWPAQIKLHAYVELVGQFGNHLKLTLDQLLNFYLALEEVITDIQEGDE